MHWLCTSGREWWTWRCRCVKCVKESGFFSSMQTRMQILRPVSQYLMLLVTVVFIRCKIPTLCIANNTRWHPDTPYKTQREINTHPSSLSDQTWRDAHQGHPMFCDLSELVVVSPLTERQSLVAFRDKAAARCCLSRWWISLAGGVHQWVSSGERLLQFWLVVTGCTYLCICFLRASASRAWLSGGDHHFRHQARPWLHPFQWPSFSPQTLKFHRKHLVLQDSCEAFLGRRRHQLHVFQKWRADGAARSQENYKLTLWQQPWIKSHPGA